MQKPTGKVLASIFWDQDGILLIDFLPKSQSINAECYLFLLEQIERNFLRKTLSVTKRVLFMYDNAPAHRALGTQKKLARLGFQCLEHPPYSPDLAPKDYHLFPGMKQRLNGRHFSSDVEVIAAADIWLDGQPSEFFIF